MIVLVTGSARPRMFLPCATEVDLSEGVVDAAASYWSSRSWWGRKDGRGRSVMRYTYMVSRRVRMEKVGGWWKRC